MKFSMKRQEKGDLLVLATAWAGSTEIEMGAEVKLGSRSEHLTSISLIIRLEV